MKRTGPGPDGIRFVASTAQRFARSRISKPLRRLLEIPKLLQTGTTLNLSKFCRTCERPSTIRCLDWSSREGRLSRFRKCLAGCEGLFLVHSVNIAAELYFCPPFPPHQLQEALPDAPSILLPRRDRPSRRSLLPYPETEPLDIVPE